MEYRWPFSLPAFFVVLSIYFEKTPMNPKKAKKQSLSIFIVLELSREVNYNV